MFGCLTENPRCRGTIIALNQVSNTALTFKSFRLVPSAKQICFAKTDPILQAIGEHIQSTRSKLPCCAIKLFSARSCSQESCIWYELIIADSVDKAGRSGFSIPSYISPPHRVLIVRGENENGYCEGNEIHRPAQPLLGLGTRNGD